MTALVVPSAIFQFGLYRQNLAVARETFPLSEPVQKQDRLLIIAPHCDDETLGAGGSIAAARKSGAPTRIAFITNGDGSRSTQVYTEAREFENKVATMARPSYWRTLLASRGGSPSRNGEARDQSTPRDKATTQKNLFQRIATMRQREAVRACEALGVAEKDVLFLGYPDGGTRAMWETNWSSQKPFYSAYTKTSQSPYENSFTPKAKYSGAAVTADIEKIIRDFRPTVILTTHPEDTHPDHWAAYSYTNAALEALRLSPDASTREMARGATLRTFLVHHGIWPAPHGYAPEAELVPPASLEKSGTRWTLEPLTVRDRDAKKAALERYVSQLVFTPHYLRSFIRKNELFGEVPITKFAVHASGQSTPQLLLKDSPCDSMWRERWPAADVREIEAQPKPSGVFALRVDLGRAPSPRVRYRLALHALNAGKTRAFQIEARSQNGKLQATLSELSAASQAAAARSALSGKITTRGFEIELSRSTLGVATQPSTLLLSANTHVGRARLDQTATATLRFQ